MTYLSCRHCGDDIVSTIYGFGHVVSRYRGHHAVPASRSAHPHPGVAGQSGAPGHRRGVDGAPGAEEAPTRRTAYPSAVTARLARAEQHVSPPPGASHSTPMPASGARAASPRLVERSRAPVD